MFTGIVEELGKVKNITSRSNIFVLSVFAKKVLEGTKTGDSISLNGVCLTVTKIEKEFLTFEVMQKTASVTTINSLRVSEQVNLERSLKVGDRISGHFVTGHIDCVGVIRRKQLKNNNLTFEIAVAPDYMKYLVPKGSIAVDGISLTIGERKSNSFVVYIIPHTYAHTTLGSKHTSDKVNVEFDILVKKAVA